MISTPLTAPDFMSLAEVIILPDAAMDAAIRLCQPISDPTEQWTCYLRSLAFFGVKTWLESGSTSYQIQLDDQIVPDAASFLQVNGLRVGVVPASSLPSASAYSATR